MKFNLIFIFGLILLFSNIIDAKSCNINKNKTKNISINNINNGKYITQENEIEIGYRFVDADEAIDILLSNREYYDNLNQNDLNYRVQKLNSTLEELEALARKEMLTFTDKDKMYIDNAFNLIKKICKERGYKLPPINDIVIAKTTTLDECNAGAYTHGTQIYLGDDIFELLNSGEDETEYLNKVIAHELFHCLTRNHPQFRKDMYSILGFTVVDKDYDFPKETADLIISNPDVEHHNSYATFEINGEKKDCTVIFSAKPFEEPGDDFFNDQIIYLVPIDDLHTVYNSEEASNFWDVFGENTSYAIDPEETLADNFSFTLIYGKDEKYETPRIIESIDAYLKSYKA